jgi:chromosome segregation ATPase
MDYTGTKATWTIDKSDRLKSLILKHVATGGTVLNACEQFELETNGLFKTRLNQLRWVVFLRHTCKDEYRQATEAGRVARQVKLEQRAIQGEEEHMTQFEMDDDISNRLMASVVDIVENRRQLADSLQEQKDKLKLAEHQILDLQEQNEMMQVRMEKKEKDTEQQQRMLVEKQSKYDQLLEDFQQTRSSQSTEYERVQKQVQELQTKYEHLNADYSRYRSNSTREVEKLETQLRDEQIKNTQLVAQYEGLRMENVNLMKRITDFASQITSMTSLLPKETQSQPTLTAVPIRTSVSKDTGDVANR